jgi:NADH:ubiquinone oxidoreductase subunit 3 (subunit A)
MHCPECGSASIQSFGKRNWLYPVALLVVIPTVFALLHQASSPIDYRCAVCGLRFARRTAAARFALFVMLFVLAGVVVLLALVSLSSLAH